MRRLSIIVLLLLFTGVVIGQSDEDWSVFVINADTGELLHFMGDGPEVRYRVTLPADAILDSAAINRARTKIAYCIIAYDRAQPPPIEVGLFDLTTGQNSFFTAGGSGVQCDVTYSADQDRFAVGRGTGTTWFVDIFDEAGDVAQTLTNTTPGASNGGEVRVSTFVDGAVDVAVSDRAGNASLVRWTLQTDELTDIASWVGIPFPTATDNLPTTGERFYTARDTNYTIANMNPGSGGGGGGGGSGPTNVVRSITGDESRTIYHNPQVTVNGVSVIEGGERLLLSLRIPQTQNSGLTEHVALDRNGQITPLVEPYEGLGYVAGTADGYIRLERLFDPVNMRPVNTLYRALAGIETMLWRSEQPGWQLVNMEMPTAENRETAAPFPSID